MLLKSKGLKDEEITVEEHVFVQERYIENCEECWYVRNLIMTSDHSRDMSFNILLTCLDF
jgi:hypothetical protein